MARRRQRRLGVLTGGGDAPGLNAVVRAVVKTAQTHDWQTVGILDGFEGFFRPDGTRLLAERDVQGILPRGGTILGTTNRGNPFAYPVTRNGATEQRDRSGEVLRVIDQLGLDALIVIGGDGSLTIGRDFHRLGVPVVGVPKTIDNDISATDVTFGFDTALNTATDALDKLHTTAESHHRVMVVEVMGRYAGWIGVEAGVAGGADVVLIPEIPFRIDHVAQKIHERDRRGRAFSIVVVAEGAYPEGGELVTQRIRGAIGEVRLGGISERVADELAQHTQREVRCTVLGHLQRGGAPTAFDRLLGSRFGAAAVRLAINGRFGTMIALHGEVVEPVSLDEAVGVRKTVPTDGGVVLTAREIGISFGDGR
ncbi:MAG TPA: ATP-dependent 6-phosphofructokinase [Dehalococcoidia bacterium]|nr:ATP-dependent 6-phosphofructokinase [Dehalococcoidia bacterium]